MKIEDRITCPNLYNSRSVTKHKFEQIKFWLASFPHFWDNLPLKNIKYHFLKYDMMNKKEDMNG